jgi:hypothetical protein
LHKACQKGTKFVWSEECGKSFETLKEELVSPPILIYPVPGKQFILDTDASNFAVGAVLSQEVDTNSSFNVSNDFPHSSDHTNLVPF